MAVKVGGIYGGSGPNELLMRQLLKEVQRIHGPTDWDDYVIDLAFCTYPPNRRAEYQINWSGIKPGPVGRTQRRFIVGIEVPPDLPDRVSDLRWLRDVLTETVALIRDHVPRKSKAHPVDRLAEEVLAISDALPAG